MGMWLETLLAAQKQKPPVWGVFSDGYTTSFFLVVILAVLVYFYIHQARAGRPMPQIRKLAGLEALDEAIGRATEMGRPVHETGGIGNVQDYRTIANFAMLGYVAKQAARYDTRVINTNADVVAYAINEEVVRTAYLEAGRPDAFNPDDVRFLSDGQFAYAAGLLGMFQREKPATNIMYGEFAAEAMILIEGGAMVGALQIGATTNTYQLPFFVAGCDYTLVGEEMFAASAYLTKDPQLTGTVVAEDSLKMLIFAVILLGIVLTNTLGAKHFLAALLQH